ncbi:hypothetical protein [Allobranchiibius sp. CTAmp26]|uniref:hypothetical protein n=1 Tax=Allobranchiibius sp. CTAmp26 TaxID=2815214 RepID=UPI001AA0E4C6|nr:hypothetical protein [Allobranchiibius sp. CTAmp26]MBO1756547.1 hypothetical protein [Allobranchiibius sp. CTAmp26]
MELDLPEGLNDRDALSLLIGRVAMSHATLDIMLNFLHRELGGRGASVYLSAGKKTAALISDCRLMVKKVGLEEEHAAIGLAVLTAASEANASRNRVVHDMWMTAYDESTGTPVPGRWVTAGQSRSGALNRVIEAGTKDLQYVARAHEQQIEAATRVVSFQMALAHLMPSGAWFGVPDMESALRGDLDAARGNSS